MNGNSLPFTMQQPLQCERAAAKIFGADCAIILQRFVWWTCPSNGRSKIGSLDEDGYKWVYFTLDELEAEFDWLSRSTIRRIIGLLEDNHLLISTQPEGWASRRKHYSVRWPMWLKVQSGEFCGIDDSGKLIPSVQNEHAQIEQIASVQIEHVSGVQNEQLLTNCNVLRPLTENSEANNQPGILAGGYLVQDGQDIAIGAKEQSSSLKTTPRKAEGTPSSASPLKKRFSPPSLDECVAYGDSIGLPCLEAEKFLNYHESRGWIVGRFPMKSWQAAMRTWKGFWQSRMSERLSGNAPQKPKPVWVQIKELEARIESHVANHNRLGYDSSKATPEAKDEWRRLKQALKDLQAGQTQAEEGAIP